MGQLALIRKKDFTECSLPEAGCTPVLKIAFLDMSPEKFVPYGTLVDFIRKGVGHVIAIT